MRARPEPREHGERDDARNLAAIVTALLVGGRRVELSRERVDATRVVDVAVAALRFPRLHRLCRKVVDGATANTRPQSLPAHDRDTHVAPRTNR